ncbi:molybdate ABC transporter substrate-binding protein [bacterium]|nr:MAG: molybdate ABC transporter substrate-binding protein [bacterium]RKZ13851.1 MAG: molybdate ABC transporter substrate-binding protein [bacterium]
MRHTLVLTLTMLFFGASADADAIHVAVASNFTAAITDIAKAFEQEHDHEIILVRGSTGKLHAQISNGAPFDAFFAADARRPELLEEAGVALAGSRFTYAVGKIVLWSPDPALVDARGEVLSTGDFHHLAIANPKLAPYGKAAEEIMRSQGVWDALQGRTVRGENIGQAFQFVSSANAQLGFVAYSQIARPGVAIEGSYWEPPQSLYTPIEQQAVLLKDNDVARDFLAFVQGDEARRIIQAHGYGTQ